MKPFGALCFIKNNLKRCIVLALMMGCVTICYMGALYIDNINEPFLLRCDKDLDFDTVYTNTSNNGANEEAKDFNKHIDDYLTKNIDEYAYINFVQVNFTSIMEFQNGMDQYMFSSVEDFEKFRDATSNYPKDLEIKDGEIVVSRMLANNIGIKEGDTIHYDNSAEKCKRTGAHEVTTSYIDLYSGDMKVGKVVDVDGIMLVGVNSEYNYSGNCLLLFGKSNDKKAKEKDLREIANKINTNYKNLRSDNNEIMLNEVNEQLAFLYSAIGMIIVVVGVVLAITVNATFATTYEKRRYEFSVYKALGFNRKEIFFKVFKETIILNICGLLAGVAVCAVAVGILNDLMYSHGLHFYRISERGVKATIICNLMVIIPVTFFNFKRTKKYDVTVY